VRIPPLHRCHRPPEQQDREVKMVAACEPRRTRASYRLTARDFFALGDIDRRKVRVQALNP
jgi:hypothetical protein